MVRRRWATDSERRAEVAEMRGYGYSQRKIAALLGVRYETVRADLEDWKRAHPGQPLPGGPQGERDRRMERVVQLHSAGLPQREIAANLRVSQRTVARDLARWDHERGNVALLPAGQAVAAKRIPGSGMPQRVVISGTR